MSRQDEADRRIAEALDAAQAAVAALRAVPLSRWRGRAARQFGDQLRSHADDTSEVLREDVQAVYRKEGLTLRPLGKEFGISATLAHRFTRGVEPRQSPPLVPGEGEDEPAAPIVVAVLTSHRGVLTGRRRGGQVTFISGDLDPEADPGPGAAAARTVGEVTGLTVKAGRELARTKSPGGPERIWVACPPASSYTEIGAVYSPDQTDVQWMGRDDVLRLMRGSLPAAVAEHLTRTQEA